ncbi:MAG: glycosyltransferase family 2 protein [Anaerolineae bacterium]|nr:glycosyltransferase family 2 protein [Anaerolineae bacterium]
MQSPLIDLSIIIVSWNVSGLLADCLDSIAAAPVRRTAPDGTLHGDSGPSVEVIVIDSASQDDSVAVVRDRFPWVHLITETTNIGFTRANNIGLAQARGRCVFLLNPDTLVHKNTLPALLDYLDTHPDVGIVGPQVLNADGTHQSTRRRFPTVWTGIFESTWLQGYAPRRVLTRFYASDLPDDGTVDVDWVQGCALMARRAVYDQIGGLDTGYVMYSEELDWCKRARLAGWRVVYAGHTTITHYGGKSSEQVDAPRHIYFQQSKLRYFQKYHGRGVSFALRLFLLLSYGFQIIQESGKALLKNKPAMRRQRVTTYLRVLWALASGKREP